MIVSASSFGNGGATPARVSTVTATIVKLPILFVSLQRACMYYAGDWNSAPHNFAPLLLKWPGKDHVLES